MYIYQPLDQQEKEVRLLRVVSPTDDDVSTKLVLELRHESLSDKSIQYAALSYVWGKDTSHEMVEIKINGAPFLITRNLHTGLGRLLRSVGFAVAPWLWIDAICINQADDFEKSWQVSQMGGIYSHADVVYMMIGSGSAETDRAIEFISRIGPRAVASGALRLPAGSDAIREYVAARPTSPSQDMDKNYAGDNELARLMYDLLHEKSLYPWPPPSKSLCAGILEMLRKDYWSRIWITQEVALAKRALLICGERSVSLDDFEGTMMAIFWCAWLGLRNLAPEYADFVFELNNNAYETMSLAVRRRHCNGNPIRLVHLLCQHVIAPYRPHYSASDPRDIFFALLGVISDREELGLAADYSKTFEEVHTASTRALLRDGELHPSQVFHLDQCVPKGHSERTRRLPSWVPDWEVIGKKGLPVYCINHSMAFAAASDITPSPTTCDNINPHILRRRGCYVDVITEVMTPPQWGCHDEWLVPVLLDPKAWLCSVIHFARLGPESGPAEDYVWRTLRKDARQNGIDQSNATTGRLPPSEDFLRLVRKVMRQEPIDAASLDSRESEVVRTGFFNLARVRPDLDTLNKQIAYVMRKWPRNIGSRSRGRTLFKTTKAMFGLGHDAIKPGDIVTLQWGTKSPIVLRPRNDGAAGGGYTFLGDAYVDGIMYGEFLETNPTEVWFDIY
ncbi:Heterokaryon incompatibility protein [Apiospora sp. TS-2023a]